MSRGWKIALWILGGLWAFFLVAITMTPHDLWQHLVAWWGVVVAGVSFVGIASVWIAKYLGIATSAQAIYDIWKKRREGRSRRP